MTAPTFLVIGAQKCGTTWLESNLGAHPEVGTPAHKELHFFDKADRFARGKEWYEEQFPAGSGLRARGEFTPNYFWIPATDEEAAESGQLPDIPQRIRGLYPDIHLIVILRDPVARAISAYYHQIRAGRIAPGQKFEAVWHRLGIRSMGEYGRTFRAWLECFALEQFHIIFHEEAVSGKSLHAIRELYRFIGVRDDFAPSRIEQVRNPGDSHFLLRLKYRTPLLARLLRKLNPRLGSGWRRFEIPVSERERSVLREFYREDTKELQHLTGRQVPWSIE